MQPNLHTLVKLTKSYKIYLYSNHTEAIIKYFVTNLRACLHGGGGPQVGEVTRLGEVKK